MCAGNIKPENERWVLGMESRLASQTMPDGGSSRLAELPGERRRRREKRPFALWRWKTASLCSLGCFASRLCRNESCLLLSALRPHTHSHLVQPQHHGSCAPPPLLVTSEAALPEMLNHTISLLASGLFRRFLSTKNFV